MGAEIRVHDPYIEHWWEFEKQDIYPADGRSRAGFFRNQNKLLGLRVQNDLKEAIQGADAVVLAVRHKQYRELRPETLLEMTSRPVAVIDCFGLLNDKDIRCYFELGCEVKGLGRGHIQRIKEQVRSRPHS